MSNHLQYLIQGVVLNILQILEKHLESQRQKNSSGR